MGTVTTMQKKTCRYYAQTATAKRPLTKVVTQATAEPIVGNDMLKGKVISPSSSAGQSASLVMRMSGVRLPPWAPKHITRTQ